MDDLQPPTPAKQPPMFKTICVSTYPSDLDDLDAKVAEMKRRGRTDMSRSKLIRIAIAQLDLDKIATRPR